MKKPERNMSYYSYLLFQVGTSFFSFWGDSVTYYIKQCYLTVSIGMSNKLSGKTELSIHMAVSTEVDTYLSMDTENASIILMHVQNSRLLQTAMELRLVNSE